MIKTFLIGGAVRDSLLGIESQDKDFAVEAPSFAAMENHIRSMGGEIFLSKPEFLTIRARVPNLGAADFVLCRKDGPSSDNRRPDSVTAGTIFDDLARRDFTMNAIAQDVETGTLIDPHGGENDIYMKVIRCVGNPAARFNEDKLRVFRALRFALTKKFLIEQDTNAAIHKFAAEDFGGVSTERIRDELFKMFAANSQGAAMAIFMGFPQLGKLVLSRGIWFEPTTRKP